MEKEINSTEKPYSMEDLVRRMGLNIVGSEY